MGWKPVLEETSTNVASITLPHLRSFNAPRCCAGLSQWAAPLAPGQSRQALPSCCATWQPTFFCKRTGLSIIFSFTIGAGFLEGGGTSCPWLGKECKRVVGPPGLGQLPGAEEVPVESLVPARGSERNT